MAELDMEPFIDKIAQVRYETFDSHYTMPGGLSWEAYKADDPSGAEFLYVEEARAAVSFALPTLADVILEAVREATADPTIALGEHFPEGLKNAAEGEPGPGTSGSPREDAPRGTDEGTPPSLDQDEEWREFVRAVHTDALPKIEQSAYVASLIPTGTPDVKFAVELGLSIMLDKPILAIALPGANVPAKLALVADEIVEGDIATAAGQMAIQQGIKSFSERLDMD